MKAMVDDVDNTTFSNSVAIVTDQVAKKKTKKNTVLHGLWLLAYSHCIPNVTRFFAGSNRFESSVQKYKGHVASLRMVFKSTKVTLHL